MDIFDLLIIIVIVYLLVWTCILEFPASASKFCWVHIIFWWRVCVWLGCCFPSGAVCIYFCEKKIYIYWINLVAKHLTIFFFNINQNMHQYYNIEFTLIYILFESAVYIEYYGPVPPSWAINSRCKFSHFWLRDLVPSFWTPAPHIDNKNIVGFGFFIDPIWYIIDDLIFIINGSDGPFNQNPCMRKCA